MRKVYIKTPDKAAFNKAVKWMENKGYDAYVSNSSNWGGHNTLRTDGAGFYLRSNKREGEEVKLAEIGQIKWQETLINNNNPMNKYEEIQIEEFFKDKKNVKAIKNAEHALDKRELYSNVGANIGSMQTQLSNLSDQLTHSLNASDIEGLNNVIGEIESTTAFLSTIENMTIKEFHSKYNTQFEETFDIERSLGLKL